MILPKYLCPVCNKSHEDFDSAMSCINSHPTLEKVETPSERAVDAFGYVDVTMSNGVVYRYTFQKQIGGDDWDD